MHAREQQDQIIVTGAPTAQLINSLPQLEGRRRWSKKKELICEATGHNREVLARAGVRWPVATAMPAPPRGTGTYQPKTEPYAHQTRALAAMHGKRWFALFMEQGTGKTKVWIDRAGIMYVNKLITGVLLVSKKGVHRQWIESELPDHAGMNSVGAFWPFKSMPAQLLEQSGPLKWLAFNYDGLKSERGFEEAERFCKAHDGKLLIICDESQEIKNSASARHKALTKLKHYAAARGIATGTPIAKNLLDEWSQLKWLDEGIVGIKYKQAFLRRYCLMGGFQNREIVGHVHIDEFKERTQPFIFRATKDEIGILPKQYNRWVFELTDAQKRHLRNLKAELETEISSGDIITAANAAVRLTKFQQVARGFIMNNDSVPEPLMTPEYNPALLAMREWLDADEGKAIIWFRFRYEAEMLEDALQGINAAFYHGGVNDADRLEAVKSFMSPNGAQVFCANPQSAGTGLNLQGLCTRALYFSNSFSAIDRWQSEDRIHRIGTNGIVTFTDLVGKGTIDNYILGNLRKKKSLSDLVLDDIRQLLGEIN